MRFAEVRKAFDSRPFQPLLVRTVSGYEYRVTTPESIISPRYATFLLKGGIHATVALEYVGEIRPLPKKRASRARGRAHR